uniref:sn-1-specific diacylglycerol lipase ABHD11 n=1 Tax=Terrapene triunguis TaxID=2587831 RepID=A0A674J518_9SAUR
APPCESLSSSAGWGARAWRCHPPSRALRSWRGRQAAQPLPLSYVVFDGPAPQPPLVFLHGLLGSKGNFRAIARALVQRSGRKVLTVDARNHGESPHSPTMSYEAMSLDVQRLLRRLHIPKCVLVGHSMGGKTAMTLALQRVRACAAAREQPAGCRVWGNCCCLPIPHHMGSSAIGPDKEHKRPSLGVQEGTLGVS